MLRSRFLWSALVGATLFVLAATGVADNVGKPAPLTKVAFTQPTNKPTVSPAVALSENDVLIFSAAPTDADGYDNATYRAIAEYLSGATGRRIVYRNPETALAYSKEMVNGAYDILFDSAALNGWRLARQQHKPLVRFADDLTFVTIVRDNNHKISSLKQLAGQTICAQDPSNPEMTALLSRFDNPVRQPVLLETKGWDYAVENLLAGKCAATIVPTKYLEQAYRGPVRTLEKHAPLPGNAFSVSHRVPAVLQEKIRTALLSAEGKKVTAALLARYGSQGWINADPSAYAQLGDLVKNTAYYN